MATWAETGFKVSDTSPATIKFAGGVFYWKSIASKLLDSYVAAPKFTNDTRLKWGTIGNQAFQKVLVGEMRVVRDIYQFWG